MEAVHSSETSVKFSQITSHHTPEDSAVHVGSEVLTAVVMKSSIEKSNDLIGY
jgi:imidazoleglycerol phosphate dehydratase HisB